MYNKGKKFVTDFEKKLIHNYGKEILESLNLQHLLNLLNFDQVKEQHSFEQFIEIIKYFVLN